MEENVLSELFTVMQKVAVELEYNKETAIQTKNEVAWPNRKLDVVNGQIKGEVLAQSCANTRDRRRNGRLWPMQSFEVNPIFARLE